MIGAEAIQLRPAVVVDDGSTDLMTNGFVVDFGRKRRETPDSLCRAGLARLSPNFRDAEEL